ncbi:thioredoxin fold domain-containing protein [Acidithiobacillus sp. MC6.1]|uniref:Thioredoxin fold domain-containing protein n=2 Tax=Acidithiobacillus ferrivorans TaxID=160808 RepID=A0A7T4WGG8_9PROT|nr:thioredoxin fold domain-containing protein [Acidithiobacillus sp. MC6.1]QQD74179.1 thioredoxin fold domain-containing protein [Acidithiobacillus ferrivorans]
MRSRNGLWSRSALLSGLLALLLFLVPPLVAAAPNGAVQDAAPLLQRLDHAHWIAQGHGPHVLYVIFDPNCPYCHVLYDELQPRIQPDQLTVRYVPVGYLAPSSFGKAAAILEAKNPLAAIQKNETGFNVTSHDGAIPEILPNTASTNALHSNMGILKATGQKIVPTLIYTRRDNTVKIIKGTPDQADLPAVLKEIR